MQYLPSFTTTETLQHLCVFYLFWSLGVLQFGLKRWSVSAVHIFTKQHLLPQKSLAISGDLNVHPIAFNAPILSSAKNQKTQEPKNKKKTKQNKSSIQMNLQKYKTFTPPNLQQPQRQPARRSGYRTNTEDESRNAQ